PGVPVGEGVADDLLLGGLRVGVAVEGLRGRDAAQQQSDAALADLLQTTVGAAAGLTGLRVVVDDREIHGAVAGGSGDVERVDKGDVALAGGVEFADPLDAEALLELTPDLGAQAVAGHDAHPVVAVAGPGRL